MELVLHLKFKGEIRALSETSVAFDCQLHRKYDPCL